MKDLEIEMNNKDVEYVLNFVAHSNQFLNGKFLFANAKLKEIFNSLNKQPMLELIDKCQEGFRYSLEFTKAFIKTPTKFGNFCAPSEPDTFIALCFNVLKDINLDKIDFDSFGKKYFEDDIGYQVNFSKKMIEPLKKMIASYFGISPDNEKIFLMENQTDEQVNLDNQIILNQFAQISLDFINQIQPLNLSDQDKRYIKILSTQLIKASQRADIDDIRAFLIALCFYEDKIKPLEHLFAELAYLLGEFKG